MSFRWPENIPELVAVGDAIERGTRRSKLRQMAVVCPGPRSHTLLEVYPSGRGPILFTERHLYRSMSEATKTFTVAGITVEMPEDLGTTETVAVGEVLSEPDAVKVWWLRCCTVVALESAWVQAKLGSGVRRAVAPAEQVMRDLHAQRVVPESHGGLS